MLDDILISILFIVLGLLIFIFVYFFGFEIGIMLINCICLCYFVKEDYCVVKCVSKLLSCFDRFIGLILIGNNLVNIVVV